MTTALVPVRPPLPQTGSMTSSLPSARELTAIQRTVFHATRGHPRPLPGLMTWVLDRRNLAAAWDRVASADGADTPGPDGITVGQLRHRVGPWLAELAESLFQRTYRPGSPRWVDIPKPDKPGQFRRIGILNFRDRVVQAALKQVLEPVLEPAFLPTSFGFRPGRSVAGALEAAVRSLSAFPGEKPRLLWAVPLDVAECFPTLDHDHVNAACAAHVADAEIRQLVAHLVAAGGTPVGRLWWQRLCGVVQGGSLSPLLCNLALHPLDVAAAKLGQDTQGGVLVLRYADDLLVLARDAALAGRAVHQLRSVLARQRQKFRREPAPVRTADGVAWLGVTLRLRPLPWPDATEFGYVVPTTKINAMLARLEEMTAPPSDKIDAAAFNLAKWIVSINTQLRDWRQAYLFADNAPDLFRLLDQVAHERVGQLLRAVTGGSWQEIRRAHLARLPRGFRTWEVAGARLTVLSSLAPQAPARLTRRPLWWTDQPEATSETPCVSTNGEV